jgi:hypothetical protein
VRRVAQFAHAPARGQQRLGRHAPAVDARAADVVALHDADLEAAGERLAGTRAALADALATVRSTTEWVMTKGLADPLDALAGATPFLRMFSLAVAGWLMARQAVAAAALEGPDNDAKVLTAAFFCEQWLPQVHGLVAQVEAGHGQLMELSADQLASR